MMNTFLAIDVADSTATLSSFRILKNYTRVSLLLMELVGSIEKQGCA